MYQFKEEDERIHAIRDDQTVGEITYKFRDQVYYADHTYVEKSQRGQGLAEQLVDQLADKARQEDCTIQAICPYIVDLFERKSDKYKDVDINA